MLTLNFTNYAYNNNVMSFFFPFTTAICLYITYKQSLAFVPFYIWCRFTYSLSSNNVWRNYCIANNKTVNKMCQLACDLNSDRYDRSQITDLNNSRTRYHSTTALTAFCCLQFSIYLTGCARWAWRVRGGRGDIKREYP